MSDYIVSFDSSYQVNASSPEEAREKALDMVYKIHKNCFNAVWLLKNNTGDIKTVQEFLNPLDK